MRRSASGDSGDGIGDCQAWGGAGLAVVWAVAAGCGNIELVGFISTHITMKTPRAVYSALIGRRAAAFGAGIDGRAARQQGHGRGGTSVICQGYQFRR